MADTLGAGVLLGVAAGGWAVLSLLLLPLFLHLYIGWRYQRRLKRMIEQLPSLLDHAVRSLKSGRTLADAVLGAINAAEDPLKNAWAGCNAVCSWASVCPTPLGLCRAVRQRRTAPVRPRLEGQPSLWRQRQRVAGKPDQADPRTRASSSSIERHDRRNPRHGGGPGPAAGHRRRLLSDLQS
jgi:hypothetical protein